VTPSGGDRIGHGGPDDRDLDDGGLDLTPRTVGATSRRSPLGRRWGAVAVLVVLAGVVGVVAWQARGATVFFKNADEAVAERESLGTRNFRLQGTVVGQPARGEGNEPTRFAVAYGGVSVDVVHRGSEPALFKAGLPVVVEGHWNTPGTAFESSRLLVKHTEDYQERDNGGYVEENPDRVVEEDAVEEDAAS
jgi:cytochrome c-type biogenesis protein CcmE